MELTEDLKDMLAGKYGEGASMALKVQVGIGECFDAPGMVPITNAHVALSNQEADLWFAEKMVKLGARAKIPPTVNPGFCLAYFRDKNMVTDEEAGHMRRTHEAYKALGCRLTYNCTPYMDTNIPFPNEITAFSESSATPFVNSVWGARTNRESAQSALCAAITGVVPEYGLLLDENRKGDILVEVRAKMEGDFAFNLLGYMGKKIGPGIPVFVGLGNYVSPESHRNLGAELNTSGAYGMYHIVGVTPEAPTLEAAFGGKKPARTVVITDEDFERVLETEISDPGNRKIDFALFGCPHTSTRELTHIANRLEGKKLAVPLWIMTSSLTKTNAEKMGLLDVIRAAGGEVVEDTCSDQPCWHLYRGKVGVTESPKCAYYPRKRGLEFVIRDMDTCIDAALKGEVK
jgi:predicted aconitase